MDENWYRKTKAVVADGGASVSFYHKGSNEAYAAEGMEGAGLLLTIGASVNSDFQELPDFTYLGFDEEEMMNYYAACPTDYQAYMGDEAIRAEYDELNSKVSGVINSAQLTS